MISSTFTLLTLILSLTSISVKSTPISFQPSTPEEIIITTTTKDIAFGFNSVESFIEKRSSDSIISDVVSLIDLSFPLLYPTAGTILVAGQATYITWNATIPSSVNPAQVNSGQTARLVLGYKSSTSIGYHLDLDNPLGTNIPIFGDNKRYDFTLPANLTTRTTYLYAFLGSSGNVSPQFTIMSVNGDIGMDPSTDLTPTLSSSMDSPSTTTTSSSYQIQTVDAAFPTDSPTPSSSSSPSTSSSPSSSSTISSSPSPVLASASSPSFTAVASISTPSPAVAVKGNASNSLGLNSTSCLIATLMLVVVGGSLI